MGYDHLLRGEQVPVAFVKHVLWAWSMGHCFMLLGQGDTQDKAAMADVPETMGTENVRQRIWEGTLVQCDMKLRLRWDLEHVDKRVVPVASLRCWISLTDDRGREVTLCRRCTDDGLSTTMSYTELCSVGTDPTVHSMQCDIVVHCNGDLRHDPSIPLTLYAVFPGT